MKTDYEQLQQQRLNDWTRIKALEEKLIKLTARSSRDKHNTSKTQDFDPEVKDIAANLYVCGSSLGADVKVKEGLRQKYHDVDHGSQKTVESHSQKSHGFHGNSSSGRGHVTTAEPHPTVTSETVTSLPETLLRIRREKSSVNLLAATYPPRPRASDPQVISSSGHGVMELGQPCQDTLRLPRISQRTSSY